VGNQLKDGLHHLADDVPEIAEVRGRGLMIGVEFAKGDGTPDPGLTAGVMEAAKAEGLLIGKGGLYGNTLRIAPPLSVTEEEAEEGLGKLTRAINRAREE
jgi:4-aminobutyrate aminotransferase